MKYFTKEILLIITSQTAGPIIPTSNLLQITTITIHLKLLSFQIPKHFYYFKAKEAAEDHRKEIKSFLLKGNGT